MDRHDDEEDRHEIPFPEDDKDDDGTGTDGT